MPVYRAPSRLIRPNRRELLRGGLAGLAASALTGRQSLAAPAVSGSDLKFVFVFANGGWDPTRVLYDGFDNPTVDMEADASPLSLGDLSLVSHPQRPFVDAFFESWWDRCVVLSGLQVPAIDHFTCTRLVTTDSPSADAPDWAAVLGAAQAERYPLPQLVLGGPTFPGEYASSTVSAGFSGQLAKLLDPTLGDMGNIWGYRPGDQARALIEGWREERLAAMEDPGGTPLRDAYASARERVSLLSAGEVELDLANAKELRGNLDVAVDALAGGLSRVVSLSYPSAYDSGNWDTHANNDADQSALFETLFEGLSELMAALADTPGDVADTLADETVVVVFSEMGRTAATDLSGGKGHWVYSSALLVGPGLAGGRTFGGYDELYQGLLLDMVSGETSESGVRLSTGILGATLLALGDVDPGERVPGEPVFEGIFG